MTEPDSAVVRTTVSIPAPIFEAAERLACRSNVSRSEFYSQALSRMIDTHEASRVTERLNDVYAGHRSELDSDLAAWQALATDEEW